VVAWIASLGWSSDGPRLSNHDERFVTPVRDSLTSHAMPDLVETRYSKHVTDTIVNTSMFYLLLVVVDIL
jgi:hypothetical protein